MLGIVCLSTCLKHWTNTLRYACNWMHRNGLSLCFVCSFLTDKRRNMSPFLLTLSLSLCLCLYLCLSPFCHGQGLLSVRSASNSMLSCLHLPNAGLLGKRWTSGLILDPLSLWPFWLLSSCLVYFSRPLSVVLLWVDYFIPLFFFSSHLIVTRTLLPVYWENKVSRRKLP